MWKWKKLAASTSTTCPRLTSLTMCTQGACHLHAFLPKTHNLKLITRKQTCASWGHFRECPGFLKSATVMKDKGNLKICPKTKAASAMRFWIEAGKETWVGILLKSEWSPLFCWWDCAHGNVLNLDQRTSVMQDVSTRGSRVKAEQDLAVLFFVGFL